MIAFRKLHGSSDPLFSESYKLYEDSFPCSERRSFEEFCNLLDRELKFGAYVLSDDGGRFAGLLTRWVFEKFVYIEHFAVDKQSRGRGAGSEAIRAFLSETRLPVIIEVETPETPVASRRIRFYERIGFKALPHAYRQPYYDGSGKTLPMIIMSNDYRFADINFNHIINTLYTSVYNVL